MRAAPLVALLLSTPGCVMLLRGTTQPVAFESDPPGAQVVVDNGLRCSTPCTLDLKRSMTPPSYTVAMQDRETFSAELISVQNTNPVWFFPALFDGLLIVPFIVDLATYALWNYPHAVTVVFPPEGHGTARAVIRR